MIRKKLLPIILTLTMIFSTSIQVLAAPDSQDTQKQNAESKLKQDEQKLKASQEKVNEIEENLQALDSNIEKALMDIDENEKAIKETEDAIKKSEEEIKDKEEEIKKYEDLLGKRVRAMYKSGNSGYVELILTSENLSEFLSNVDAISRIIKSDKEIVDKLEENKKELYQNKNMLKEQNTNLLKLKADIQVKLSKLNDSKKEQSKLIEEAKKEQDLLEEKVAVSKEELDEIIAINKYVAIATSPNSSISEKKEVVVKMSGIKNLPEYAKKTIIDTNAEISRSEEKRSNNSSSNNNTNKSGNNGSLSGEDVKPSASAMAVVNYSYNFLGVQYVWGGETPSGFDCSGFVKYCYAKAAGVYLTRTTYTQINEGTPVDKSNLAPGDLVFFGTSGDPNHVGMYIGGGKYIHAPRTGDVVKVADLNRVSNYLTARRIIN